MQPKLNVKINNYINLQDKDVVYCIICVHNVAFERLHSFHDWYQAVFLKVTKLQN